MQTPCPYCGALTRPGAKFCPVCGQPLSGAAALPAGAQPTQLTSVSVDTLVTTKGQIFDLLTPIVIIGREAAEVQIADRLVSRQHARLEQTSTGWQIVDLNSSNGTFINGAQLVAQQPCRLQPGDQIVVGTTALTFNPIYGQARLPGLPANATQLYDPAIGLPAPIQAGVQWQQWQKPPQVEGHVVHIDATPHAENKSPWGRVALAGALAVVAPRLALVPMMLPGQVAVRNMRVEDRTSHRSVAVRIKGDLVGDINIGDVIAIWARTLPGGVLEMLKAYNYTTEQEVTPR